jgi:glycosyltransferase involved in cell wall biosynthesis
VKSKLRIAFVIKRMDLPGGGAERVLAMVSSELARRGHEVTLISRDALGSADFHTTSVPRIRIGSESHWGTGRARGMLEWLPRLRGTILALKPDVAVGFMHSSYLPLGLALRGTGVPVLASEHTVYDHYRSRRLERLMLRATPHLVHSIAVVSTQARASFPSALQRKMIVVANPVTALQRTAAAARKDARCLLAAVGRLDRAKDHATLISAFAAVADEHPKWDLAIAGEGECRQALEEQIVALGLTGRARLLGAVVDIGSLLSRADAFAMTSRYESFGLATAEALMHGLPAVGFADCAGTNELIVDRHNGLLVQPGEDRVAALAAGLRMLFEDKQLGASWGANGPASVAKFSLETIASLWEDLLRNIART